MPRILIVEDELHLAQGLQFNLEIEGYESVIAENGETAWTLLETQSFALVVLDVMLPGMSGFELAERLRAAANFVPILMLTARSRSEDVLRGFAAGADDYLPKPFELNILLARIRGLLRRMQWQRGTASVAAKNVAVGPVETAAHLPDAPPHERFAFAARTLDFTTLELTAPAGRFQLTLMEASLLRYFLEHRNQNVSRKQILEDVWGLHEDTDTRAIDNFIVRLRRYIEDEPTTPRILVTVRGIGYRFLPE